MKHSLFQQFINLANKTPELTHSQVKKELDLNTNDLDLLLVSLRELGLEINYKDKIICLDQTVDSLCINTLKENLPADICDKLKFESLFLTVDSTNTYLKNTKEKLKNHTRICLTEQQTAGRGRQGKTWVSPFAKNVYLSLHIKLQIPIVQLGGVSLVVGISIIDALTSLGIDDLKIKWPNDIYWHDKKLAGILIESTNIQDNNVALILGIGINVDMPALDANLIDQAWVDIKTITKTQMNRNTIVASVIEQTMLNMEKYQAYGLSKFMKQWEKLDILYQQQIQVLSQNGNIEIGNAQGINEKGELLMSKNNEIVCIHAGEISVRKVD